MTNKPLRVQLWFVLCGVFACLFLLVLIALRPTLNAFFTKETYTSIDNAQQAVRSGGQLQLVLEGETGWERQQELQNIRAVQHIVMLDNGRLAPAAKIPGQLGPHIRKQALTQTAESQRYSLSSSGDTIRYIISKTSLAGRSVYLISYMWDTYQKELTATLFKRLALLFAIVTVIGLLPAYALSHYLTRPLRKLQEHVRRIAAREWHKPVPIERSDEIGELSVSIESMRKQLVQHDEAQQEMLQQLSHELKTPVMVIHSYAQAILDGIYPKGSVEASVQVIESEADRLSARIAKLLFLTKLDYIAEQQQPPVRQSIRLDKLAADVVERLSLRRPELSIACRLEPGVELPGDESQLTAIIENLVDNGIRFAHSRLEVSLSRQLAAGSGPSRPGGVAPGIVLEVWNDGEPLDPELGERLFQPFQHGKRGQFGLGLAIVSRAAKLHGGRALAENARGGVRFTVYFGP
ncbi:ATP-binding protein [Paenibacillus sp. PL2-23]|uniref:sensor histidine kinase n=1 Tax=Paenibacillus sp. PL2-23 TaxID=2100729 RepID=UPI0030F9FC27